MIGLEVVNKCVNWDPRASEYQIATVYLWVPRNYFPEFNSVVSRFCHSMDFASMAIGAHLPLATIS